MPADRFETLGGLEGRRSEAFVGDAPPFGRVDWLDHQFVVCNLEHALEFLVDEIAHQRRRW